MNERIKELADDATHYANGVCDDDPNADWYEVRDTKFAELVRQDEKEKCAKLFDAEVWSYDYREIAAAIRGRTA
jgi:hypothetical protein